MKNRFLGMKIGSRTRPDRPRPRKTWKTDRNPRQPARTLIRDGGAYCIIFAVLIFEIWENLDLDLDLDLDAALASRGKARGRRKPRGLGC